MEVKTRKKLIEVALPLEAINDASAREKSIRHGHPSTLHLWWARRPLAAARAVIFSQMVDDPSSHPEIFQTEAKQEKERQRLFRIIEQLVVWENTTNEKVLNQAREEIRKSWRYTCADNKNHPQAKELFNPENLPAFHDPFAGGGSLPLEAQRLGLEAYASDLNPVAVLICKAMIEIPPKFAGKPPVNPEARKNMGHSGSWKGAAGLAEDVRYYGRWMRDEAEKSIGHLYPKIEITAEMVRERPDLKPYLGRKLTVIAWLWARTIKSPNPAFNDVDVPLVSTFILSTKPGKEAYIEPIIERKGYHFSVRVGKPNNRQAVESGTKLQRANFKCIMSGTPISGDYIKTEGKAGRISEKLIAIVAEGDRGRVYLSPNSDHETVARQVHLTWKPEQDLVGKSADQLPLYGMKQYWQLFTPRELVALATLSELVQKAQEQIVNDILNARKTDNEQDVKPNGNEAQTYAEAVSIYLAFGLSRQANRLACGCIWNRTGEKIEQVFARQAIAMTWDFAEANIFSDSTGGWAGSLEWIPKVIEMLPAQAFGHCFQADAAMQNMTTNKIVSTDPPYYDNICYADLSDYFYVWLRHSLKTSFTDLFSTVAAPKVAELIASPYRHKTMADAESFFLHGMTQAMGKIAEQAHRAFPVTIYYAFKQSETTDEIGTVSTGWETFLEAVIRAGFNLSGTWPIRTERDQGLKTGSNVLASSIIMVCRPNHQNTRVATRRDFITEMKRELPLALKQLQLENIAPVDLQQSAIGPGMAIFTRYSKVIDIEGKALSVRNALMLINQVLDEVLAEQEGDFDADTRWALSWFEQFGFNEGEYGVAETLSKAKNTSISGMVSAGILNSKGGRVRLFKPSELLSDWDPAKVKRVTIWEMTHQLIRVLESVSEAATAELLAGIGGQAEVARELSYRLYTICDRKKRMQEASSYNGLVQSWPEIKRLAGERNKHHPQQSDMFGEG